MTLHAPFGVAQGSLGIFEGHTDVGKVSRPGTVAYDQALQQYTIAGSGQNMWASRDDFHFVWKKMSGNFILSLRAKFVGKGVDPHRKVGWSIRPSFAPDGPTRHGSTAWRRVDVASDASHDRCDHRAGEVGRQFAGRRSARATRWRVHHVRRSLR
jgi:hypothetical protein